MRLTANDLAYVRDRAGAFVGRKSILATIDKFMAGPPGVLVLRGPPGCGKTAIAACLATGSADRLAAAVFCRPGESDLVAVAQSLSDQLAEAVPGFADERAATLAPEIRIGSVTITTGPVAPGATVTGVRIVLDALGGERAFARGVVQPLRHLLDRRAADRVVILVDALDEAGTDDASPLPALLRNLPGVRLVVTTRDDPRVLRHLGGAEVEVDLLADDDEDISTFVRLQLQGRGTGQLAERIVTEAHGNFLYARYVVDALIKTGEFGDRAELPEGGLTGVYRQFVRVRAASNADLPLFRAVISGVTVARGQGVTVPQLANIASEALGRPTSAGDVRVAVQRLAQFLSGASPDGPFRPYHRSFAEFLTSDDADAEWRVDEVAAHRTATRALVAAVATDRHGHADWQRADDYTRQYLVGHAADGGMLRDLMNNARFVAAADPGQLLPALRRDPSLASLPNVRAYRRSGAQLYALTPAERAAQVGLVARQISADEFAEQLAAAHGEAPWFPLWSHWRRGQAHTLLGRSRVPVRALALSTVDGVPVAVWGDDDGMLRCSDVVSGVPAWPAVKHGGMITAVATGTLDGRPVALSGGDGGLRLWDLSTGKRLRRLSGRWAKAKRRPIALALASVNGDTIAIAGFWGGELQLWDVGTGKPRGTALTGHRDRVTAIAVTSSDGNPICVSVDGDGGIITRDLATGAVLGGRTSGKNKLGFLAVAAYDDDGTPTIVCAGYHETIYVLDALSGSKRGPKLRGHQDIIRGLAVLETSGRRLCVSAADDETLRIWDLAAGKAIGEPLRGHQAAVKAVGVTHEGDEPVVVSCGEDGALRSWHIDLDETDTDPRPPTLEGWLTTLGRTDEHQDQLDGLALVRFLSAQEWYAARDFELNSVEITEVEGHTVALTCGEMSGVHAWDLGTGERVGNPHLGDPTANLLECIAVAQWGEDKVVIAGGADKIHAWYLPDGDRVGVLRAEQGGVYSVAVRAPGPNDESLVFASGGGDGTVRFWDLVTGTSASQMQAHQGKVTWLAVDKKFTISASSYDGTLKVWHDGEVIAEEAGVSAASVAVIGGRRTLVFADRAGAIRARELASLSGVSHLCDASGVDALTVGMWRARPFLVAGGESELKIWPMSSRAIEPIAGEATVLDLGARVSSLRIGPRGTILAGTAAGVACIRLNPKHFSR
jgi:WD40 repeat protein